MSINHSEYNSLYPFKAWVQQTLPAIYDDSLSYTDLLAKMLAYMNGLIENDNNLTEDMKQAYDYINNYFDNLDVQDEIDKKLDEMVEDGTLYQYLGHLLPYVTFEMFGAEGDGKQDDTVAIESTITFAKNTKLPITSLGQQYKISKNITFDNLKLYNFGLIIGDDTTITITNHSDVTKGSFKKCNLVCDGYYCNLRSISIFEFVGNGLYINPQNGNDNYVTYNGNSRICDIFLNNYNISGDTANGIIIDCSDLTLENCLVINAKIAYTIKKSNVSLISCYAWINSYMSFENTKFISIAGNAWRLINCTSDSYETSISMPDNYYNGSLSDFNFLNNNTLFHDKTFTLLDHKAKIIGNANIRLTNFSTSNNTFNVGNYTNIDLNFIDGAANDCVLDLYGDNLNSSNNGTISSDSSVINHAGSISIHSYVDFSKNPYDATKIEVLDIGNVLNKNLLFATFYTPAIFEDDNGDWSPGYLLASIGSNYSHNITLRNIINSTTYKKVVRYSINIELKTSV